MSAPSNGYRYEVWPVVVAVDNIWLLQEILVEYFSIFPEKYTQKSACNASRVLRKIQNQKERKKKKKKEVKCSI